MSEWIDCPKCGENHENQCACPEPSVRQPEEEKVVSETKDKCTWQPDEDGTWSSQCGLAFVFNEQGPKENHFKFCPKCGKEIVELPLEEEP